MPMQEPAENDTNGKQKKHKQGARNPSGPEQELDLNDSNILNYEQNNQANKSKN